MRTAEINRPDDSVQYGASSEGGGSSSDHRQRGSHGGLDLSEQQRNSRVVPVKKEFHRIYPIHIEIYKPQFVGFKD